MSHDRNSWRVSLRVKHMTYETIRDRCCTSNDYETALQHEACDVAREWIRDNPPAVGCSARDLTRWQKGCHKCVVATMRQRAGERRTGFGFDPASVFLIWNIVSLLWSLWGEMTE